MKILCLESYYAPETAASLYLWDNIFEAFAENGFETVIYTPVPTRQVSDEVRIEYKNRLHEEFYGGKLKVNRFPLMKEGKNPLIRAIRYFVGIQKQYRNAMLERDADVIYINSTPPLNLLLVKRIKKRKKSVKIVYNLQDIFPDSLVNTGLSKKGSVLWKIGRKMENSGYKAADKIVVISEDFKENIMSKGVPEEKIEIIRNWVDENAVVYVPRSENKLFDEYNLDRSKFYISYSGNVGLTQNMDMLLDVAKELADRNDIGFVIVGDGAYKNTVEYRVRNENISNVTLLPFQPYDRISEVFSLGDCGLIISKANVGSNSVPSKTWSIMSASRPVLASFDKGSELDRIVTENECGICVEADNKEMLKKAIIEMISDSEKRKQFGTNGRLFIEKNLTKEIGTSRWIEVINSQIF